jgi:hypothetical protein
VPSAHRLTSTAPQAIRCDDARRAARAIVRSGPSHATDPARDDAPAFA